MRKEIRLTGGAGFIGSHLVDELININALGTTNLLGIQYMNEEHDVGKAVS